MPRYFAFGLGLLIACARAGAAEPVVPSRYDLGQHLRAFERAWDAQPDAAARRRALPALKRVVPLIFANRFADTCAALDETRFLLRSADATPPALRWAESLLVRPATRLLDPSDSRLSVELTACYDGKAARPDNAEWRLTLQAADGTALPSSAGGVIAQLPTTATLPTDRLPEGDHTLCVSISAGGRALATYRLTISVVPHLRERRAGLLKAVEAFGKHRVDTDQATLRAHTGLVWALANGQALEMDYPGARLLDETEALAKAVAAQERYYGPDRPGDFWLTLATSAGEAPVRVFVPEAIKAGKPVPLVFALHGAGGSENLYFDGYGAGATIRLAKARGWMVVGVRAGGVFDKAPPVPAIIDELTRLYPVDRRRVYAIGHSMGAAHAVATAQQSPGVFAAFAALGGGGSVNRPEALKAVPVFVGCGTEDFALNTARGLANDLTKAGARVTAKEYADVEHITIVREALNDVFAFFEASDTHKKN